jgi:UDP-GlcNAc3NAcA epimerase
LRDETEWVELVEHGFNVILGPDPESISKAYGEMIDKVISSDPKLYGDGTASDSIVNILKSANT